MKIFRLEEASALLPVIKPLLEDVTHKRRDHAIAMLEAEVARGFGAPANEHGDSLVMRRSARDLHEEIRSCVEEIHRHGCIVKDLDLGLVDFPALRGGQLVNLCWKMDEPAITHWHGVDEGFAARKPLSRKRAQ
ncbi:MAG: DUF2203 domain-containing protein [Candidatus Eremiobacteraeota bacterium]|nr:DUF2203 domain-containing protein [Candidatus Eremiobacteraeota bacterium]MBV8365849.1 DUF2203 domain-containing protein [Candidatus Eremiobacteraeota bacterium]